MYSHTVRSGFRRFSTKINDHYSDFDFNSLRPVCVMRRAIFMGVLIGIPRSEIFGMQCGFKYKFRADSGKLKRYLQKKKASTPSCKKNFRTRAPENMRFNIPITHYPYLVQLYNFVIMSSHNIPIGYDDIIYEI